MPAFMRLVLSVCLSWGMVFLTLRPGFAQPPEDFDGDLFIDASGCVLERVGRAWQERLLRDGVRDCGYPPTPLGRHHGGPSIVPDLPLPEGMRPEEEKLLAIMTEGLIEEDLRDPASGVEALVSSAGSMPEADTPGSSHPVLQELAIALGPNADRARAITAGMQPNARLCALLGAGAGGAGDAKGGGLGAYGFGVARGFCPDLGPDIMAAAIRPASALPAAAGATKPEVLPGERQVMEQAKAATPAPPATEQLAAKSDSAAVAAKAEDDRKDTPDSTTRASAAQAAAPKEKPTDRGVARPVATAARSGGQAGAQGNSSDDTPMIPANARYLQIGGAVPLDAAEAQFRRLAALGLPPNRGVIQTQPDKVLVMVGPFSSREEILRAYDQLRKAGFGPVSAR